MGAARRLIKLGGGIALLLWLVLPASAAPVKFYLPQVSVYLPRITVFTSLLNQSGKPVQEASASLFMAKLDGYALPITKAFRFKDSKMGVAYTLVLDVSMTMSGSPFKRAVEGIKNFINGLGAKDRLAIVTFGNQVSVVSDFSADKTLLFSKVDQIKPTSLKTLFYSGVKAALELNQRYDSDLPVRRAIIVVSDGKDEGSGITLEDLLKLNGRMGIPIYCLGYTRVEPQYLDVLKRLSDLNGGFFLEDLPALEDKDLFNKIKSEIESQIVLACFYEEGRADGSSHLLQLIYNKGQVKVATEKTIYFDREALTSSYSSGEADSTQVAGGSQAQEGFLGVLSNYSVKILLYCNLPTGKYWQWGLLGGAGLLALVVLIIVLLLVTRRKKEVLAAAQEISAKPESDRTMQDGQTSQYSETTDTADGTAGGISLASTEQPAETNLPVIEFVALSGPLKGEHIQREVGPEGLSIGRKGTQIEIEDAEVSRLHCLIIWTGHRILVKDEGSKNGTLLNGVAVQTPEPLDDGSTLELGGTKFRVKLLFTP